MTAPEGNPIRIGDRYRIEERIGAGAMGAVWRATDELLNRTVAVKELLAVAPGTSPEAVEESRQRILREGRIGARLQHAHVISMFDVVVHDERPWLVMEYLPSDSLATVLKTKGPLSPLEVADIGRQVADGLAAAHLAGVVHRDIKPGNVLIAEDGRVKVADFGVSRAVDDVQLTRTGLIAGTPAFLSPEVAQGAEPLAASDIFALGATLYAAVEGVPPFGLDDNAYALLHKVATGDVEPPLHAGPLTGVLMRLLATDPDARPSAAQARDLLAAVADGRVMAGPAAPTPTAVFSAAPPPPPLADPGPRTVSDMYAPAPPPHPRRRRTPIIVGALIALLVLGGGIAAALLLGGNGAPTTPAAAAPTTTAAEVTTSEAPSPTAEPTTSPTPTPTTSAAPPTAGDPVAFVQNYYSLLPDNPAAAFALLGPDAQSASGGQDQFERFYANLRSVTLLDPQQTGDNTVSARVQFVRDDGTTTNESYRFVMATADDGSTIMESFSRG
jgi:eukaryotic-like serine/threonine-protein kinase